MKAMTYDRYGDPDVLQLTDQPMPRVGPGEVRCTWDVDVRVMGAERPAMVASWLVQLRY